MIKVLYRGAKCNLYVTFFNLANFCLFLLIICFFLRIQVNFQNISSYIWTLETWYMFCHFKYANKPQTSQIKTISNLEVWRKSCQHNSGRLAQQKSRGVSSNSHSAKASVRQFDRSHWRLQGGAGQLEEPGEQGQHGAEAAHLGVGGAAGKGQPRH